MTPWAVLMVAAFGLSAFYALGRWHGEWRYGKAYRAGHDDGYRKCLGEIARGMHTNRRHRNERESYRH